MRYVDGDYNDAATFTELEAERSSDCERPAHYLAIPPSHVRDRRRGARASGCAEERARDRREAVRARPRVGAGAQPGAPLGVPRAETSSGSTTTSARRRSRTSSTSGSPTRSSSRSGTATTCARCRSRWPRTSACRAGASSTRRSARCATSSQNHLFQTRRRCWRWSRRSGPASRSCATARRSVFARDGDAQARRPRARPVRGLPRRGRRRARLRRRDVRRRAPATSTRGAGPACRSTSAPARTCPVTCTEVRVELHRPPHGRVRRVRADCRTTPTTSASSSTRASSIAVGVRAKRRATGSWATDVELLPVQRPPRRGDARTSGCSATRSTARPCCSRARTASRRRGGWSTTCSPTTRRRSRTRCTRGARRSRTDLIADPDDWHDPVVDPDRATAE